MMRIISTQFLLFLGVALSGCNAAMDDVSTEPEEVVPVEGLTLFDVKVSQQAVLFTKLGESVQLTARGIDEFGNEVSVDSVVWTTSNGDEIVVDQDGTVTSVVEVGSSAVVAIADGVHSEPVIVAAVRPKENSVFYQDEQVLRPPELLEETENGNLV